MKIKDIIKAFLPASYKKINKSELLLKKFISNANKEILEKINLLLEENKIMNKEVKAIQTELKLLISEQNMDIKDFICKLQENYTKELLEKQNVCIQEVKAIGWQHLGRFLTYQASMETAKFIIKNMPLVKSFENKFQLLDYTISIVQEGYILEFGVFQGETINYISSKVPDKTVYGFDSFKGLPEDWRTGFSAGTFNTDTQLPVVNQNVSLVQGWFNESLINFVKTHNDFFCALIHIDCDLYSSTKTVFSILKNHIHSGTIIVFDEFFNYPGWDEGEYKAFSEFINDNNIEFEYIGYSMIEQCAVRIK